MIEKKDYVFEAKRMMDFRNRSDARYHEFKDNLCEIIQKKCDEFGYKVNHIWITDEWLSISLNYLNSNVVKEVTALFGRECTISHDGGSYKLIFKYEDLEW